MRLFSATLPLLLGALAATPPGAQDGAALLQQVAATYRGLTSYEMEGAITVELHAPGAQQSSFDMPVRVVGAKPSRVRSEMHNPLMGNQYVSDGTTLWTYIEQQNSYTRKPLAGDSVVVGGASPINHYFTIADHVKQARVVGTRVLDLGNGPATCTLVEVDYERPTSPDVSTSPTTYWVERARSVVLRESTVVRRRNPAGSGDMEMVQTTNFPRVRLNQPIADTAFVFHPPADAKEVATFTPAGPPQVDLSGQKAPDFSLTDTAGKPHRLSALKGRVVMLDFWATWCGPCRIEMPVVQKLSRELKLKGLVTYAVNFGEDGAKVRPFLLKNKYTMACLLDRDQSVGAQFQVSSIPTLIIIDKTGTIASYFVGVRDEGTLREALAKAGIH